jgi:hypothetical protein
MKSVVQHHDISGINKIDEGIPDIAEVFEVEPVVRKVEPTMENNVENALEVECQDLVGQVAQHDGRAALLGLDDFLRVDLHVLFVGSTAPGIASTARVALIAASTIEPVGADMVRVEELHRVLHRIVVVRRDADLKTMRRNRAGRRWILPCPWCQE